MNLRNQTLNVNKYGYDYYGVANKPGMLTKLLKKLKLLTKTT